MCPARAPLGHERAAQRVRVHALGMRLVAIERERLVLEPLPRARVEALDEGPGDVLVARVPVHS